MDRKQLIHELARTAGNFIKTADPKKGIIYKEGRGNFVTAADLASEKIIIDGIKKSFPEDAILSEETEASFTDLLAVNRLWVIDPIDGTNNYASHRNYSCVSIGYVERGKTILAAAYNPFVDEFFFAEKGQGAFVNTKQIQIGTVTHLPQAYVSTDNSYEPEVTKYHLELLLKLQPTPMVAIKGSGVLAMCEIASGRMDLYFHSQTHPWDNAAAVLLVEEAGGIAKNFDGTEFTLSSRGIIVGNKILVDKFIAIKDMH